MSLLRDNHGRHAVVVARGRDTVSVVILRSGRLNVRRMPLRALALEGWRVISDYPMDGAVNKFLMHSGGVSAAAKKGLLRASSAQVELVF